MVQPRNYSAMEGFNASYSHFEELVGRLEEASAAFTVQGGLMDEHVAVSIRQIREGDLASLAQKIADYKRASEETPKTAKSNEVIRDSLYSFISITDALNVKLAESYEALPEDAKALVTLQKQFELLVESKPMYLCR